MKKLTLFLVFASIPIASCTKATTSNLVANNSTISTNNLVNSENSANSNFNVNNSNKSTNFQTKSEVNSEMLKQIEAQQLETADPRKVTKQNTVNNNLAPKRSVPPGMQN